MASTSKCRYCGAVVSSEERYCPSCGAPNEGFVADTVRRIITPSTIEELKEYCAERNMPLLRMRFFIGEDQREPRAYGIYRDGNDFIVYKNKADGQRAIRYQGPDEAHAVRELFLKLMAECRLRGISPEGRIQEKTSEGMQEKTSGSMKSSRKISPETLAIIVFAAIFILVFIIALFEDFHSSGGYYDPDRGPLYYPYQNDWDYSDNSYSESWYGEDDWNYEDYSDEDDFPDDGYEDNDIDYFHYSGGDDRDSDWGSSSEDTDTWVDSFDSSDSGDDWDSDWGSSFDDSDTWDNSFDSWDSGDTDWDSDW